MRKIISFVSIILFIIPTIHSHSQTTITIDAAIENGMLKPVWAWFGYDEPNYTYTANGRKLLSEIAQLSPVPVYVRTHNLLTSGDGKGELKWGSTNAYTEDKKGRPIYQWNIVDSIVDTYVERHMRPLMEIGFMPEALSTHPQPYKHNWSKDGELWTGWSYPPKDYKKWNSLVREWVKHSIERYGKDEVKKWYWELWNEPNIGYWSGTFEEYCKLYDYSADAIKSVCPECIFGGPHTTNPNSEKALKFFSDFLAHCATGKNYVTGRTGSPLDYIAFHAKGSPSLVNGSVTMNMSPQLKAIDIGFKTISSFEKFKNLPVVIGENDPEGCAACSIEKHPQNAYRNGTMYSSYTASSFARIYDLAQKHQVNLAGILTWAFEFENQPWFYGFRDLATNGVDKPVLNVFRMFGLMPARRLQISNDRQITAEEIMKNGVRARSDVHALASRDDHKIAVMVWNYHDNENVKNSELVNLLIQNVPSEKFLVHHYRIDQEHSNSFEIWKKLGSPQNITKEQLLQLQSAGQLALLTSPEWKSSASKTVQLDFELPTQAVSLITIEW